MSTTKRSRLRRSGRTACLDTSPCPPGWRSRCHRRPLWPWGRPRRRRRGLAPSRLERVAQVPAAAIVGFRNEQLSHAERQQRMSDGRARATRAEKHDGVALGPCHVAAKRFRKSPPIGVVTDGCRLLEDDRIDGTERSGIVGQVVESGTIACLQGWVTFSPANPSACTKANRSGRSLNPSSRTSRSKSW